MPAILVPSKRIIQPPDFTAVDNSHWLFDQGGEVFSHVWPIVNGLTGQIATNIAGATHTKQSARGVRLTDVDGSDRAIVSQTQVTPPADCTLFAIFSTSGLLGSGGDTLLCGFPMKGGGSSSYTGGNAHMSIHGSLDYFGAKILAVDLSYNDATTETIYLTGSSSGNRSVWFVAASYKDASLLDMYARDLVSGEEISSSTSKTKSLTRVAQNFNIASCAPNGTSSWALTCTRPFAYVGWVPKFVPRIALAELGREPFGIFRARRAYFIPSAGGGGATGTLAATESGSDTASIAGDVLVSGALASSESGSDTAALTGDVLVSGSLAVTESGSDAAAFTGTASVTRTGSLAATESGSDTAAVAGLVLVRGTLAAAESGADTAAFAGDASAAAFGSLAATETGADTAAVSGLVLIRGGLSATESGSDTASATGLVLIRGSLSATESGSDTAAISGTSAIIGTGALAAVEIGSDTAAISGVVRVSGSIAATESGSDTAALAGVVPIRGALAATEAGADTADISSFRPTVPGIEYTLPEGKAHYTLPDGRAHFTIAA